MSQTNRYPLAIPNSPDFFINDNATPAEQAAVFLNLNSNTGIVSHSYTGMEQDLGSNVSVGNNDLLIDSSSTNPKTNPDVVPSQDLIPGGLGMPENPLLNFPSSDGLWNGLPIWDYSSMEIINSLPVYQGSRTRLLDNLNDIIDADQYDFFAVALPANSEDALINWKDTFRTQVSIPPESYLVMIAANDLLADERPNGFRLQVFDDGAGEYIFDTPFNILCVAGSEIATGVYNSRGPYILQSPLAIAKPGLLTVTISNVNTPTDELDNPIEAYVCLIFAVPKKCRYMLPVGRDYNTPNLRGLVMEA